MKYSIFLLVLCGLAITLSFADDIVEDDGSYRADDEGVYVPDDEGQYRAGDEGEELTRDARRTLRSGSTGFSGQRNERTILAEREAAALSGQRNE